MEIDACTEAIYLDITAIYLGIKVMYVGIKATYVYIKSIATEFLGQKWKIEENRRFKAKTSHFSGKPVSALGKFSPSFPSSDWEGFFSNKYFKQVIHPIIGITRCISRYVLSLAIDI